MCDFFTRLHAVHLKRHDSSLSHMTRLYVTWLAYDVYVRDMTAIWPASLRHDSYVCDKIGMWLASLRHDLCVCVIVGAWLVCMWHSWDMTLASLRHDSGHAFSFPPSPSFFLSLSFFPPSSSPSLSLLIPLSVSLLHTHSHTPACLNICTYN